MASYAYTFTSGDTVTPTKLNNARTVSDIVNADVSATAAIAGTKVAPNFGSQNIVTTGSVGIGTVSPATTLHVSGSAYNTVLQSNSADSILTFRNTTQTGNATHINGVANDLAFVTSSAERMRIDASGNVGIGVSNPATKLEVSGDVYITGGVGGQGAHILRDGSAGGAVYSSLVGNTIMRAPASNNSITFQTNSAERMRIDANGNVGIGTSSPAYTLHVNGSVAGTSAYNNLSDAREKENIVYGIANALDTVKALKPAKFDFKEGDKGKIGFIAQDVQPLVPEVITSYEKTLPDDTKEERLSIQESSLTAVLVAAVQELSAKVEALEAA